MSESCGVSCPSAVRQQASPAGEGEQAHRTWQGETQDSGALHGAEVDLTWTLAFMEDVLYCPVGGEARMAHPSVSISSRPLLEFDLHLRACTCCGFAY